MFDAKTPEEVDEMLNDYIVVSEALNAHEAYIAAGRWKERAVGALNDRQKEEFTKRIKKLRAGGADV